MQNESGRLITFDGQILPFDYFDFTPFDRLRAGSAKLQQVRIVNLSSSTKALTKNSYFDSLSTSPNDTTNEANNREYGKSDTVDKSLQMTDLGIDKEPMSPHDIDLEPNTPGRTRTCGLRIRNPLLYPAELRAL